MTCTAYHLNQRVHLAAKVRNFNVIKDIVNSFLLHIYAFVAILCRFDSFCSQFVCLCHDNVFIGIRRGISKYALFSIYYMRNSLREKGFVSSTKTAVFTFVCARILYIRCKAGLVLFCQIGIRVTIFQYTIGYPQRGWSCL